MLIQDDVNYLIKFLNFLKLSVLLPHSLPFKIDTVMIMLRNICKKKVCNTY